MEGRPRSCLTCQWATRWVDESECAFFGPIDFPRAAARGCPIYLDDPEKT